MGRHEAPDESSVHPLVADALGRRGGDVSGSHREDGSPAGDNPLGWPGPTAPGDGRIGWPGRRNGTEQAAPTEEPAPAERAADRAATGGWRRFFRPRPAA